jgi:hypothetical protein
LRTGGGTSSGLKRSKNFGKNGLQQSNTRLGLWVHNN